MNELSNIITNILAENGFIKSDDYAACQYGIDVFLISAMEIGFILITSIFLKNSIETILWLLAFIPIRIYAGGYHADTRLKCFGAFIVTYLMFSLAIMSILIYPRLYLFMTLSAVLVIFKWAPLQHENKHVSDSERLFYRKMALIWVSIEGIIAIVILLLSIKHTYAIAVLYGLFTAEISLLVGKIKNNVRNKKNMEKLRKLLRTIVCKHGVAIASFAFVVTMITANSQCTIPFYEPEEPVGLSKFKKFKED